jgi:divalent metal cation (Fe/Co/Zn/Cd) transporter
MIALIEFIAVGVVFFGMVLLSGTGKLTSEERQTIRQEFKWNMVWHYKGLYVFSLLLIGVAMGMSYQIVNWYDEILDLVLSCVLLFIGFFLGTATYLRMIHKIIR